MEERTTTQMTEQEVKKFKELYEENQKIVIMAGIIKLQEYEMEQKENELKEDFQKYLINQDAIKNELELKYGKGHVDSNKWVYVKDNS